MEFRGRLWAQKNGRNMATYEKATVKLYFSFRRREATACFPVGLSSSPIRALHEDAAIHPIQLR
jgi:hypothetical protein